MEFATLSDPRLQPLPRIPQHLRVRMVRVLARVHLAHKTLQVRLRDAEIQSTRWLLRPERQRIRHLPAHEVDARLVDRAARGVAEQVVLRRDDHRRVRRREDRVRQIRSVGRVMHAQVEVEHNVLLIERLAVEKLVEVDDGLVGVPSVIGVHAARLGVLALDRVEVVRRPIDRFAQNGRVLDDEVVSVSRG